MATSIPNDESTATTSAAEFDFSQYRPQAASAQFTQFTQNLRQLHDVVQSANPDADVWATAAAQLGDVGEASL